MIWYKSIGQFSLGYSLPLHLCSLMCIIMPIMAITKSPLLMEYCYAMGLAPALLALITPDVYFYPAISFIYIQTIIVHGIICIIPIFMVFTIGFKPNIRNLPKAIALLIGLAVAIIPVNYFTNGNYFFLRYPAPGSIMETFAETFGKPGYLVPTFLLGCIMWVLLYAPFTLMSFKTDKRIKNEGQQSAAEHKNTTERQKVSEQKNTTERQKVSAHKNTTERQKVSEHKNTIESHNVSETQVSTEQHKETALR